MFGGDDTVPSAATATNTYSEKVSEKAEQFVTMVTSPLQKLSTKGLVGGLVAVFIVIVIIIAVVSYLAKVSDKYFGTTLHASYNSSMNNLYGEGYTGAGSGVTCGDDQDQAAFKDSQSCREGYQAMGPEGYRDFYKVQKEGFSPSPIMKDSNGYYFTDADNAGRGNVYLDGVPLSSDGSVLSSFLTDQYGRSFYYSSNDTAFTQDVSSGAYMVSGSPNPIYVVASNMLVDIGTLPTSMTRAQLNEVQNQLGCSAPGTGSSSEDPWGYLRQQQKEYLGVEGMKTDMDAKLVKSMQGVSN